MKSNSEGEKMAVKAKKRKKLRMQELIKNSKKIKWHSGIIPKAIQNVNHFFFKNFRR